jgi:hypothetical protein
MSKRLAVSLICVLIAVIVSSPLLWAQLERGGKPDSFPQRVVVKVSAWEGVVTAKAKDGFNVPGGMWTHYMKGGWALEDYVVGPAEDGKTHALYAILRREPHSSSR